MAVLRVLPITFTIIILLEVGGAVNLQCACNTDQCREQNKTTCDKAIMCYTQYLKRRDGSNPITKGCLATKTSLLCENRPPAVANWPILSCCKNHMCNEQLPAQFNALMGNTTTTPAPVIPSNVAANDPSQAEDEGEGEIEDPREEDQEVEFPVKSQQETNFEDNKIYNDPRFLTTIKRPEVNIVHTTDHGLTNFHVAVLIAALACLFLLFLLGFVILRRQARLFSTPYMAPSNYHKDANLTHHEHHCTPTRMPLPRAVPVQMARTPSAYVNKVLHQQV